MIYAGIDAGSRAIKVVLMRAGESQPIGVGVADQGVEQDRLATALFNRVLAQAGIARREVARVVGTGYARASLSLADTTVTEITCHARGVHHLLPATRTVIEIGGQDSKVLRLEANGGVRDFAMNDRCAAGTGRFLEVVANRLDVGLDQLGAAAAKSRRPAAISSMCVVFAETEIIGLLSQGVSREDILAGVQSSVATRVAALVGQQVTPLAVFTGGVALISGMALALERALGTPLQLAPDPQMTGALGAALIACRQCS